MIAVKLEGIEQFRAALSRAKREIPQALQRAGKPAGERILIPAISRSAPRRSGRLASSYRIETRAANHEIVSTAPYGAGAEWGRRGKWAGFGGPPPRFAGRALDDNVGELGEAMFEDALEAFTAFGWFR